MSDRIDIKSKSKPSIQTKGKVSKPKSKENLSSYTPNKYQNPKEHNLNNNKINPNNSEVPPKDNNHFNINNNISININIEIPKSRNKSMNIIKTKNNPDKKSISIKKIQYNNNSLIFNTLKYYNNKNNSKKGPFHIRIKSANIGLKDFKYNNSNKNVNYKFSNNSVVDANHKNNINSTMNDFKKIADINKNKAPIEKNISLDNIKINENKDNNKNNAAKKDQSNPKIISKKQYQNNKYKYKKNVEKKRGNFSPSVNRELLNRKQNTIFNYSTENRENNNINNNNKTFMNEMNNKILKLKDNFGYMGSSQMPLNNQISKKKIINHNSKENNINTKISNLNDNRKHNLNNNKNKSPFINDCHGLKSIVKNIKNMSKKQPYVKSHNVKNIKNVNKFNKNVEKRDSKEATKEKDENKQKEEEKKIDEEKKKQIEEEKINKEQNENKIEEEQKRNQMEEKKRKMNPSKSQNDIGSEFIKKNLENNNDISPQNLKPSDPASKKIRQIKSICKKGFAGPGVKKTNQDNFFIYKNFLDSPDHIFLGVCDGHGMFGHDVSGYLVNHLPQNLNTSLIKDNIKSISSPDDYPQISNIISMTFVQTNINIVNDDNVETTFSGTTCSSLIFSPTKIISANVGDSRCVLGKFDGKNWKAKNLTRDHKPTEEDEKKRIIEKGGRIESYKDEEGEFVGPERVWLKTENVPGLAMTRSFGDDVAHSVGVISQPEIFEYNIVNEDKFILLASDGIWEFISSDECVNIVKDYYLKDDIDGALDYLYKESSKRWIMEEEVIDDTTLIIMFLN